MSLIHTITQGTPDVRHITRVQFGIRSPESILRESVSSIHQHVTKSGELPHTLMDPRLGATRTTNNAVTGLSIKRDPGNWGHCSLALPVYHPIFFEHVKNILKIICPNCSNFRTSSPTSSREIIAKNIRGKNIARSRRLKVITEKILKGKAKDCEVCHAPLPEIVQDNENQVLGFALTYKTKDEEDATIVIEDKPGAAAPAKGAKGKGSRGGSKAKTSKKTEPISSKRVYNILKRITDDDADLMGFAPKTARPEWLMISVLPIPPPTVRPSVIGDNDKTSDDDLTQILHNIIRHNNQLQYLLQDVTSKGNSINDVNKEAQRACAALQLHVAALIDNETNSYNKVVNRAHRPLKTIKSRHKGKTGRVRNNIEGKRTNWSSRSVITADPKMRIDQVGVPYEIAKILTYEETVNAYNIEFLTTLVHRGPDNYPGANETKKPGQELPQSLHYMTDDERQKIRLTPGMKVYRHMLDWDIVIFNRQPSLHKMNMMGHYVKVLPGRSFRLSVNVTGPYAADFDGDEMNLHLPQNEQVRREWEMLALSPTQFVSPQGNRPVIGTVQDTMLGTYRISSEQVRGYSKNERYLMNIPQFMHLANWITNRTTATPEIKTLADGSIGWTSTDLFNLLLPPITLTRRGKGEAPRPGEVDKRAKIEIINGVMTAPELGETILPMNKDSNLLDATTGSLFHIAWNDLGPTAAQQLIDNLSLVTSEWFMICGISVGLRDLELPSEYYPVIEHIKGVYLKKSQQLIDALVLNQYTDELRSEHDLGPRGLSKNNAEQFEVDMFNLLTAGREEIMALVTDHIDEYTLPTLQPDDSDTVVVLDSPMTVLELSQKYFDKKIDYWWAIRQCNPGLVTMATQFAPILAGSRVRIPQKSRLVVRKYDNRFVSMVDSGSKGKKINAAQIIAILGQQDIVGGRAKDYIRRRPMPFFPKDDLTPEARGFIRNSYTAGLSPIEYIFHAMAGRLGVISTSIKTAETGYMQRKLVKRLEDLVTHYDGTVRLCNGAIVQIIYGGDGYDGSKIEKQNIDYLPLSLDGLKLRYGFLESDLDAYDAILAKCGAQPLDRALEQAALDAELEDLVSDWTVLRQRYKGDLPTSIPSVINFDRIMDTVQSRLGAAGKMPYLKPEWCLRPSHIRKGLETLVKQIQHPTSQRISTFGLHQFFALVRSRLSSKILIFKKGYTVPAFDDLIKEIVYKFYDGIITPGESVGVIAAQSIGEPSTQMTLDAFHSTGQKLTVSGGVPRFKEILSLTKMKTPSVTIYLKGIAVPDAIMKAIPADALPGVTRTNTLEYVDKYLLSLPRATTEEYKAVVETRRKFIESYIQPKGLSQVGNNKSVKSVQNRFQDIVFSKLVKTSEIFYVDDGSDDPFATPLEHHDAATPNQTGDRHYPSWVIVFELNKDVMSQNDIYEGEEITGKFTGGARTTYLHGVPGEDPSDSRYIIHAMISIDQTHDQVLIEESGMLKTHIKGVTNIDKTVIRQEKCDIRLDNGAIIQKGSDDYEYYAKIMMRSNNFIIDTVGSNLLDILNMDHVDPYKTYTNDINEMFNIYGIEVARRAIIRETNDIMVNAGAHVDLRHIELLADAMTCRGFLQKIDRYGARRGESGPIAMASFEETTSVLCEAAAFSYEDNMTGASANVMFGQFIRAGTNCFDVLLDEAMIIDEAPEPVKKEVQLSELIERNTMYACGPEDFHFDYML